MWVVLADGDVLLIGPGSYPGFTIQDRSLSVFAADGAAVEIEGAVQILDLALQRTVVIAGLTIAATTTTASGRSPAAGFFIWATSLRPRLSRR